jgi:predicted amidohydrolase YtcJ
MLRVLAGLHARPICPEISALRNRFQYRRETHSWHPAGTLTPMRRTLRRARVVGRPGLSSLVLSGSRIVDIRPDPTEPDGAVVDLGGALVTPGFVDAHVHLTQTGLMRSSLDLRSATSRGQVLDALAAAATGAAVLGGGWDEHGWPDPRPPSAAELQRAAGPDVVVWLARVDGHSSIVSAALLAATPELAELPGYWSSGWLRAAANSRARQIALGALTIEQRRRGQLEALDAATAVGIGCVHEMASPELSGVDDLAAALRADHPVTVIGYWGELNGTTTAARLAAAGAAGDLSCDGSVGSRTAWFSAPYRGSADHGLSYLHADQVAGHVLACTIAGLQAGFHAIGDAAVAAVVEGTERAARVDPAVRTAGHRIEHAELVDDPRRLAATGLIASVQPAFDAAWGGPDGMYADRLGADRAARMNDFAGLAAAGVPLAFGSDSPVTPLDPWGAVRAAAYPHNPASALSVEAAFEAHTRGGWLAARRDGGVLAPGGPATLAVWQAESTGLSGLPDVVPGRDLPRCLATFVDGRIAFDVGLF